MSILHIAVRTDIPIGRQMSQVAHVAFEWAAKHGAHHGPVHILAAASEDELKCATPWRPSDTSLTWREPDLKNQRTAFATFCRVELPMLGASSG